MSTLLKQNGDHTSYSVPAFYSRHDRGGKGTGKMQLLLEIEEHEIVLIEAVQAVH